MDTARILAGCSTETRRLARRYLAAGWTAHRSNSNHLVFRAPDGVTTASIARQLKRSNRSMQNGEAPLKRWLREQKCDSNIESA